MEDKIFDILIVGGGPAGLTAGIYACRSGLSALIIEEFLCGGQTLNTYEIKNFPGFENINGADLSKKMENQAKELGVQFAYEKVQSVNFDDKIKQIFTKKNTYKSKSVILCLGAKPRTLNVDGEQKFTGRGVSYCAVCDGEFFKDKVVAIVGGGNSAMEDVAYLTNLAKKTYLINRSEKFRAIPTLVDAMNSLAKANKITLLQNSNVVKINGDSKVTNIEVKNSKTEQIQNINVDGIFIEIGRVPDTSFLNGIVDLDEYGYIKTDDRLMTNVCGVFSAGDCRQKQIRQIVTACSDGAIAATNAISYCQTLSCDEKI